MSRFPMRDGWRVLMRAPGAVVAEIVWRWTFGATALVLLFVSFHQYFSGIEISSSELGLMKSLEVYTWMAISARVLIAFIGGMRALGPILIPALSLLWVGLATVGRAISVRVLTAGECRTNWLTLIVLNVCRVLVACAGVLAYFGVGIIVSSQVDPQTNFALNVLVMFLVLFSLATFVSIVNWYFSTAAIFASRDDVGVRQALLRTSDLKGIGAVNVWFALIRVGLVGFTTLLSLMMVGPMLQPGHRRGPLLAIVFITLVYFAISDALYIWRLATYIGLTEPETGVPQAVLPNARILTADS